MNNNSGKECIPYREFEIEANRDPRDAHCPVRLGGFEWLESKLIFEDSVLICSRTCRCEYWNADAKLHSSGAFRTAFVSTTNCVGSLLLLIYLDAQLTETPGSRLSIFPVPGRSRTC